MARDRASRPEARPLRLFAAVDLAGGALDAVEAAIPPWRDILPEKRWVPRENWHITVKFMGRTWPRLVTWVHERCAAAAAEIRQFRVRLGGMGVFPSPGRARVLWVGLDDPEEGLAALAAALDRELEREFEPEKRGFTAHLTVARFNPPIRVGEHRERLEAGIEAPPSLIDRLVLYRSHLSPRGARYEALERFPLAG